MHNILAKLASIIKILEVSNIIFIILRSSYNNTYNIVISTLINISIKVVINSIEVIICVYIIIKTRYIIIPSALST